MNWQVSNMSSEYMAKEFVTPININEIAKDEININKAGETQIISHRSNELNAKIKINENKTTVVFPIAYFPGWQLSLDGKNIKAETSTGRYLISATLDKGNYVARLKFENTPVRTIGNIVSIISLAGFIFFLRKKTYGRR